VAFKLCTKLFQLGLTPTILITIVVKKKKIREHAYVSVARSSLSEVCVEEMCGELGSGSCMEEVQGGGDDDDKARFYGSTLCV
jgi:hypothetical protein